MQSVDLHTLAQLDQSTAGFQSIVNSFYERHRNQALARLLCSGDVLAGVSHC